MKAIIMAGGLGKRMGGIEKPLIDLCGKPMIEWVVRALEKARNVDSIIVAVSPRNRKTLRWVLDRKLTPIITKGLGYEYDIVEVSKYAPCLVVPSDTPLITGDLIDRIVSSSAGIQADIVTVVTTCKTFDGCPNARNVLEAEMKPVGISVIKKPLTRNSIARYTTLVIREWYLLLNVNTHDDLTFVKSILCGV